MNQFEDNPNPQDNKTDIEPGPIAKIIAILVIVVLSWILVVPLFIKIARVTWEWALR